MAETMTATRAAATHDPMASLIRQISRGLDQASPEELVWGEQRRERQSAPSPFVELASEDGHGATEFVIVSAGDTPEELVRRYGHRIISAGYIYREHTTERARERLMAASQASA